MLRTAFSQAFGRGRRVVLLLSLSMLWPFFAGSLQAQPSITTPSTLSEGTVGAAYSQTLSASGGTPGYTWSVVGFSLLPAGLSLSPTGVLSGTPTAAGSFGFNVEVTDSTSASSPTKGFTIKINAAPLLINTPSPLPGGTVGAAYSQTMAASGGTPGYTWSVVGGTSVPAGLSLSGTGVVSGTPTAAGSFSFTLQATDSGGPPASVTKGFALKINPPPSITTASPLPDGTVGGAYSQTMPATGGTPGYIWSVVGGTSVPAGLSLSGTGVLSGTPTTAGSFSFTIGATDSSSPPIPSAPKDLTLKINPPPSITTVSPLPEGTVGAAYLQTMTATGGTPGYSWSLVAGSSAPAGLSLSSAGALSGTPTAAGSFTFTVQATDSSNPPVRLAPKDFTLKINPAPPSITTASPLPDGTVGTAYSQTLAASGGTPGFAWSVVSSLLPAGLSVSQTGVLGGTPTTAGTFNFVLQATDSGAPVRTAQKAFTLKINPAEPVITTASSLPDATVGTPYSRTLAATGGTPPFTWSVVAGSFLPGGLSLSAAGVLSGTPITADSFIFTLLATDSGTPVRTAQRTFNLTISAAPSITTQSPLPAGTVGVAYSQTLAASGGTPGYAWSVVTGTLPPGLSLSGTGALNGTPSTAGSFSFTIRVTDSSASALTAQKAFNLTIGSASAPLSINTASALPAATVGAAYSPELSVSGGTPGYTWSVAVGSLPAGLSLSPAGVVSGTPTTAGSFSFTLQVSDSGTPAQTVQKAFSLTINPASAAPSITTASPLPGGTLGAAYSQTLTAAGGTPGYTWSVVAPSSLPAGLTLAGTGVLSGTPGTAGSFSFTIGVTDSGIPAQTAKQTFTLLIDAQAFPSLTLSNLPSEVNPTQQLGVTLALTAAAPAAVSGTLRISFTSHAVVPLDDPMVLFSNGSRTVGFTIPASGTVAVFSSPVLVLTGTVAGTITLTADIPGKASQVVGSVDIRSLSPVIGSVAAVRTSQGLRVDVTGYSTERRVLGVEFGFKVRIGSALQDVKLARDVQADFDNWYRNAASSTFGSSFVFSQSFAVQGDSTAIESVTVTLTNGQGGVTSSIVPFSN